MKAGGSSEKTAKGAIYLLL